MLECLVDGEISDRISVSDRGLQYGDGVFETLAMVQGQPRFWQSHMDRLADACERLQFPVPAQSLLLREVHTVSAGHRNCVVKIMLRTTPATKPLRRDMQLPKFPMAYLLNSRENSRKSTLKQGERP